MKSRTSIIIAVCIIALFSLSISPLHPNPVSAHIARSFGNYIVEVGWEKEPALTNQMNAVQVTVVKGSKVETGQPVINALADMKIVANFGTVTKALYFLPSPTVNGQYLATLMPTKVGTYNLVLNGTIQGQSVNTEIPLDEVQSVDTISFPQTSSSGVSDNAAISSQLGTIINELTGDINDAKKSVNTAAQNYDAAAKSFQDAQDSIGRLYMISMVGIGMGCAGVVIGVIAIVRKS
jgi:hypothetical protein